MAALQKAIQEGFVLMVFRMQGINTDCKAGTKALVNMECTTGTIVDNNCKAGTSVAAGKAYCEVGAENANPT